MSGKSTRALKMQGNRAEKSVSQILNSLGSQYVVFDNVMLRTKKGTTQIDHVVISNYGVFVIETKSHKGMIFGDCFGKNWTQVLYSKSGTNRYQFYSPYKQNFGHLRSLYKLFGLDYCYYLGLIVFTSEDADLSNVSCPNAIYSGFLWRVIKGYTQVLLSNEQVSFLCKKLSDANCQSAYRDKKHIEYVKSLRG